MIYVGDWIWGFLSSIAPLQASCLLMCLVSVGLPISWAKLVLGPSLQWIGWSIRLNATTVSVTSSKTEAILAFLSGISCSTSSFDRRDMDSGGGSFIVGYLGCTSPSPLAATVLQGTGIS